MDTDPGAECSPMDVEAPCPVLAPVPDARSPHTPVVAALPAAGGWLRLPGGSRLTRHALVLGPSSLGVVVAGMVRGRPLRLTLRDHSLASLRETAAVLVSADQVPGEARARLGDALQRWASGPASAPFLPILSAWTLDAWLSAGFAPPSRAQPSPPLVSSPAATVHEPCPTCALSPLSLPLFSPPVLVHCPVPPLPMPCQPTPGSRLCRRRCSSPRLVSPPLCFLAMRPLCLLMPSLAGWP